MQTAPCRLEMESGIDDDANQATFTGDIGYLSLCILTRR
jgi:hypothetical protein